MRPSARVRVRPGGRLTAIHRAYGAEAARARGAGAGPGWGGVAGPAARWGGSARSSGGLRAECAVEAYECGLAGVGERLGTRVVRGGLRIATIHVAVSLVRSGGMAGP